MQVRMENKSNENKNRGMCVCECKGTITLSNAKQRRATTTKVVPMMWRNLKQMKCAIMLNGIAAPACVVDMLRQIKPGRESKSAQIGCSVDAPVKVWVEWCDQTSADSNIIRLLWWQRWLRHGFSITKRFWLLLFQDRNRLAAPWIHSVISCSLHPICNIPCDICAIVGAGISSNLVCAPPFCVGRSAACRLARRLLPPRRLRGRRPAPSVYQLYTSTQRAAASASEQQLK